MACDGGRWRAMASNYARGPVMVSEESGYLTSSELDEGRDSARWGAMGGDVMRSYATVRDITHILPRITSSLGL